MALRSTAMSPPQIIRPIVLVVDDDAGVLEALRALLAPRVEPSYRLETAMSAEEALTIASAASPELKPLAAVISDERMPGRQGTDLLIALRQAPAHRHGGRIIVTGYAGLESAERAINEAEVVRYYPKPWDDERQLLPAIGEILQRFARDAGLDDHLLARTHAWDESRSVIEGIRRLWWQYLTLMGMTAAEAEIEEPAFVEPADESATHVLVTRHSPRGMSPAASLRLELTADAHTLAIAAVAFVPEEANEATETLLLRSALLEARSLGVRTLRAEIPALRHEVYEALGFVALDGTDDSTGTLTMSVSTASAEAVDGPGAVYARRHEQEHRQCLCSQSACPTRDYASPSRGYSCPLDALEGRQPPGFPAGPRG
jgi:CheY-like chemotaxis protein